MGVINESKSESPQDFANRANRLTDEELVEMIEKRLPEKAKELKDL